MKFFGWLVVLGFGSVVLAQEDLVVRDVEQFQGVPSRIAFGSCANQDKPQPVLQRVVERHPDVFVYLGDNIYADTRDMGVLKAKYAKLAAKPEFQSLRKEVTVLATWDDHDYGENDSGKDYPFRKESRDIFFDFWRVSGNSPRRSHEGIYGAHLFSDGTHRLQIILLDTRSFRDPLKKNGPQLGPGMKNDYQPDPDANKTFLGAEQWSWFAEQLLVPADVRIVASSIQFGHEYNGYESWTNLPREQQKMIDTIVKSKAAGVIFISGDVHWGEFSRRDIPGSYPLYDVTASGITEDWHKLETNQFRVGKAVQDNHFGQIVIDWTIADPTIELQLIDRTGTLREKHLVHLSELQPK